jgi:pyridoxal phosphate enzyme (YggS family)
MDGVVSNRGDFRSAIELKGYPMKNRANEIARSADRILGTIPKDVTVVAAAKGCSAEEVESAIQAGFTHIGHNYLQEAKPIVQALGRKATWHLIGHLQRNKVSSAIRLFDMIETVDSLRLAQGLERRCASLGRTMLALIEVNSGRESRKTGVLPEELDEFVTVISDLEHIRILGLMTMGPRFGDPEESRPYFIATREAFLRLSAKRLPNVSMKYLSMGMSNSYLVAIEEGANIVRIGTKIFGQPTERQLSTAGINW